MRRQPLSPMHDSARRRALAAARLRLGPNSGHRAAVGGGLRLRRQHARDRPAAGPARRRLRRHGGRRPRSPRPPSCSPTACSSWCTARSAIATARCRWSPSPALPPPCAALLSALATSLGAAHPGALPDRRHQLGDHPARHRLARRQCRLRAAPGDARPLPDRPDAGPDDRRGAGRRDRRLAGLALGVLGAGGDLRRGRRRAVRRHARAARHRPARRARGGLDGRPDAGACCAGAGRSR